MNWQSYSLRQPLVIQPVHQLWHGITSGQHQGRHISGHLLQHKSSIGSGL
jgi:hypothetical protein